MKGNNTIRACSIIRARMWYESHYTAPPRNECIRTSSSKPHSHVIHITSFISLAWNFKLSFELRQCSVCFMFCCIQNEYKCNFLPIQLQHGMISIWVGTYLPNFTGVNDIWYKCYIITAEIQRSYTFIKSSLPMSNFMFKY